MLFSYMNPMSYTPSISDDVAKMVACSIVCFRLDYCSSDVLIVHQCRSRSGFSTRQSLQSGNVADLRGSGSLKWPRQLSSCLSSCKQTHQWVTACVLPLTAQWLHRLGTTMESRKGAPSLLWSWLDKNRCREPDSVHDFFRFFHQQDSHHQR